MKVLQRSGTPHGTTCFSMVPDKYNAGLPAAWDISIKT